MKTQATVFTLARRFHDIGMRAEQASYIYDVLCHDRHVVNIFNSRTGRCILFEDEMPIELALSQATEESKE